MILAWEHSNKCSARSGTRTVKWTPRSKPDSRRWASYCSGFTYTHAARQLPTGKWTSKLGKGKDIEHDTPEDVAGGLYGELQEIMKRPLTAMEHRIA